MKYLPSTLPLAGLGCPGSIVGTDSWNSKVAVDSTIELAQLLQSRVDTATGTVAALVVEGVDMRRFACWQ